MVLVASKFPDSIHELYFHIAFVMHKLAPIPHVDETTSLPKGNAVGISHVSVTNKRSVSAILVGN